MWCDTTYGGSIGGGEIRANLSFCSLSPFSSLFFPIWAGEGWWARLENIQPHYSFLFSARANSRKLVSLFYLLCPLFYPPQNQPNQTRLKAVILLSSCMCWVFASASTFCMCMLLLPHTSCARAYMFYFFNFYF